MEDDRAQVDIGIAADIEESHAETVQAPVKQPKKRFIGRRAAAEVGARSAAGTGSGPDGGAIQGMASIPHPTSHR